MGQTPTYALPYPELDDADDVPADVRQLADQLELILPTFQEVAEYGQPSGYAPLDANGKVPAAHLPAPASQVIVSQKKTAKDVVNTNAAVDLFNGEIIIPANTLTLTGRCYLVAWGDYLNNTGGNKTLQLALTYGGASLWLSNNFTLGANSNRRTWRLALEIFALDATHLMTGGQFFVGDAATGAQSGQGGMTTTNMGGPMGQNSLANQTFPNPAPVTLQFTAQHSATSAQQSCRLLYARAEIAA